MEELISVIVPVYNNEKHVRNCVESLLNQSYENFQLIIIDDGSTDRSSEICEEYRKKDSRVTYFKQPNGGVASARNRGLKLAKGDYITFADSDDMVHRDWLSRQYEVIKKSDGKIVVSRYKTYTDSSKVDLNENIGENNVSVRSSEEAVLMMLTEGTKYQGYIWNKMFKREIIYDNGEIVFDEDLHMCEDLYFCSRCFKKVDEVLFNDIPLYYYYENLEGITSGKYSEKLVTQLDAYYRILKLYSDSKAVTEVYRKNLCLVVISQYSRMIKDGHKNRSIENTYRKVIKENYKYLQAEDVNSRDKLLGKLIKTFPVSIYRFIYSVYCKAK